MVTIPDAPRRTAYAPTSATTAFPIDFVIFDNDDLYVAVNGVERTDYAVSATYINGAAEDGVVNAVSPGWTGSVVIEGRRSPRREDQFQDGMGVPARFLNLAFNRLTATVRELYDRLGGDDDEGDTYTRGQVDGFLAGKANAQHSHVIGDVAGLSSALAGKQNSLPSTPEFASNKGKAGGYPSLGSDGKVPASQLPSASSGSLNAKDIIFYPTPTVLVPVAQRLGQEVFLTDGYVEGSNLADFSDLIEANIARAVSLKRPFVIPQGEFAASRKFTATGTGMAMFGFGKSQSAIVWTADAASSGLDFSAGPNRKRPDYMIFQDFALFTKRFNDGEALRASFEAQLDTSNSNVVIGNRYSTRFKAEGLAIAGYNGGFTDGWNKGGTVLYEIDAIFRDCQFNGPIASGGEPNYLAEWGFYIGVANGYGHPTGPFIDTCNVFHAKRAVVFEGNEGGVITNSQLVGVVIGADFVDGAGRPLFMCTNNHINAFGACIRVDAASQIQIIGNSLYHTIGADRDGTGVSIAGTNARSQHLVVQGNVFESAIGSTKVFTAVTIFGCDHGIIDGNTFRPGVVSPSASNMRGIVLGGDARFIKVGDNNIYEDNRSGRPSLISTVEDGGTGNSVPGMGARFTKSNNQSFSANNLTTVTFDGIANVVGNYGDDMSDGVYTIPSDGVWQFTFGAQLSNGTSGGVTTNIQKNASSGNPLVSDVSTYDAGTPPCKTITTGPLTFSRGDYVRPCVNSGTTRSILGGDNTFFEARRVS